MVIYLPSLSLIHFFQGEIDILEGVNDQGTDQITLHTSPGALRHSLSLFVH